MVSLRNDIPSSEEKYVPVSYGRGKLAPNQNTAFHLGNRARLPMTCLSQTRSRQASQLAYSYERDFNFYSKTTTSRDHR